MTDDKRGKSKVEKGREEVNDDSTLKLTNTRISCTVIINQMHIIIIGEDTWMIHFHLPHGHYKKEFLMKWNALAADLAGTASVGSFNVTSGMLDRADCDDYLIKRFGLSKDEFKDGPVIR